MACVRVGLDDPLKNKNSFADDYFAFLRRKPKPKAIFSILS